MKPVICRSSRWTLAVMALLVLILGLHSSVAIANFTFYDTFADWTAAMTSAGLTVAQEDLNAFPNGPLPSFSVSGVDFNSPIGSVFNGDLPYVFIVGPDVGGGTIGGAPLFGFGVDFSDFATLWAFDTNGGIGSHLHPNSAGFLGVISDVSIRSLDVSTGGDSVHNLWVATATPEPGTLMLLVVGIGGIVGFGYFQRRRKMAAI